MGSCWGCQENDPPTVGPLKLVFQTVLRWNSSKYKVAIIILTVVSLFCSSIYLYQLLIVAFFSSLGISWRPFVYLILFSHVSYFYLCAVLCLIIGGTSPQTPVCNPFLKTLWWQKKWKKLQEKLGDRDWHPSSTDLVLFSDQSF